MRSKEIALPTWPPETLAPEALMALARRVRERAYAPYSHFSVGAALLMENGGVAVGCNVENASYGLTCCAERNAVGRMVAEGLQDPRVVAVAGPRGIPCLPCGACRQVLAEFYPGMLVLVEQGEVLEVLNLSDLLPRNFGPGDLLLSPDRSEGRTT